MKPLEERDYAEPCCPFDLPGKTESIPLCRVLQKLDEYLEENDYAGAFRHLDYWLAESSAGRDLRGRLSLLNELIGLCRKSGQSERGLQAVGEALALVDSLGLSETVSAGTTLVNAATALKAFGRPAEALPLYERACSLYGELLEPDDARFGSLYNNMALAEQALGQFDAAEAHFDQALAVMGKAENGALEQAITYCNLADLALARLGAEGAEAEIGTLLAHAEALLRQADLPHDAYYAFVLEKCAPCFGYYGYFVTEAELRAEAARIRRET